MATATITRQIMYCQLATNDICGYYVVFYVDCKVLDSALILFSLFLRKNMEKLLLFNSISIDSVIICNYSYFTINSLNYLLILPFLTKMYYKNF